MSALHSQVADREREVQSYARRRIDVAKYATVALFLLPGLALLLTFLLIPVVKSAYYSLWDWNGLGGLEDFVGLENYKRVFSHKIFRGAVLHSVFLGLLSLVVQLPLSLGLALLLTRGSLVAQRFFKAVFFVPYVFSEVITAIIWLYVFHPNNGLVNIVFMTLIPGFENQAYLANGETVLFAIFAVLTWKYFGLYMLLYMAGLQNIPPSIEDAARIDGANEFNVLRYVTIPMLGSTLRLTVYLSMLGSLQQFIIVWILTEGGSVFQSEVIVSYLYKFGLQRLALGYGSAVAVILFAMTLLISLGYQKMIMKQDLAS